MAWLAGGSAPPTGAAYISAGVLDSKPSYVCRAKQASTWFAGTSADGLQCTFASSGTSAVVSASGFEVLTSLPVAPTTNWTGPGLTPLNPSPSSTPSASPSPSSSAPVIGAGVVATFLAPVQTGGTCLGTCTARGYPGSYSAPIPAVRAGTEADGKAIYVCIGYLANGDALAGKYSLGTGWSWCDIPHDESEENDLNYALIRDSPYLVWYAASAVPVGPTPSASAGANASASAAPSGAVPGIPQTTIPPALASLVPNATLVTVGTYNGQPAVPCRAWQASGASFTGPHAGTYGLDSAGRGQCSFGYGAKVVHAPVYDLLYVLPADADTSAAKALVTAVPYPSASVTPSVTPTASPSSSPATPGQPQWMAVADATAAGYTVDNAGYMLAGADGTDYSRWPYRPNNLFVCRGTLAGAAAGNVVPGRYDTTVGACSVPWGNGSDLVGASYDVLIRSPWLAWAPPEGTMIAGANGSVPLVYPSGSFLVEAGRVGTRVAHACRAYHPGAPGAGPFPGYTLIKLFGEKPAADGTWPAGVNVCTYYYGGRSWSVTPYDLLVQLPAGTTAAQWNRGGAPALAAPSPSPTPTPTPTSSPSAAPPVPGVTEWRKGGTTGIGPVVAGVENAVSTIYVCRGYIPGPVAGTVDMVPGKYESNFKFCDIPVRGAEMNDAEYDLLRANPLLTWVPHNASGGVAGVPASWPGSQSYSATAARGPNVVPSGATLISGGSFDGLPATVCRAYHPSVPGSGPHAGYTDGELYGSTPLCFFSYGGKVVRTAPFDYLYMYPLPSASPSPVSSTPSPTTTRTASNTPSTTPSSSGTASNTGTPAATPSNTKTPTPTPTSSSSKYPSSTPSPSRTPTTVTPSPTSTVSVSPSLVVTVTVAAAGNAAGGSSSASSGPSGLSMVGIVAAVGIGGVCLIGALRKRQQPGAQGTAVAGATGEGDRVRIVTAAA